MDNCIKIKDINWNHIYLHICLEGDCSNRDFVLMNAGGKLHQPLDVKDNEIQINITRVSNTAGQEMLPEGKWIIACIEDGQPNPLPLFQQMYRKIEHLDKVFPYWKGCYAYIAAFTVEERNEGIVPVLQTAYMRKNEKPKKEYIFLEGGSTAGACKKAVVLLTEKVFQFMYKVSCGFRRKDGGHILLMSETKPAISGNLYSIDKRLKERGLTNVIKVSYSFHETLHLSSIRVALYWMKLVIILAKQDFVFIDDYAPIFKFLDLDKKTKLIQVWHAGVGFKSVGYSRFGKPDSPRPLSSCHRKYDYVVVGSQNLIPVYQEVFGIGEEHFLPYGLPRIDQFLNSQNIEAYNAYFTKTYPDLTDRRLIVFAPTYRGAGQKEAYYPYDMLDIDKLFDFCGEETIFAFKMHPFIKEKPHIPEQYRDRIIDLSEENMNDLLHVSDILISDYSSVIYEFSLLNKPMLFYSYDKEEYELIRGFHWDYETYAPGKICTTFDQLLQALQQGDFCTEKIPPFTQYAFDHQDPHNADRIIDNILTKER